MVDFVLINRTMFETSFDVLIRVPFTTVSHTWEHVQFMYIIAISMMLGVLIIAATTLILDTKRALKVHGMRKELKRLQSALQKAQAAFPESASEDQGLPDVTSETDEKEIVDTVDTVEVSPDDIAHSFEDAVEEGDFLETAQKRREEDLQRYGDRSPESDVRAKVSGKASVAEEIASHPLVIKHNNQEIKISPKENLGLSFHVEQIVENAYSVARRGAPWQRVIERISLIRKEYRVSDSFLLDENSFNLFFAQLQSLIEQPARNAGQQLNRIIPAQIGIEIDKLSLLEEIEKALTNSTYGNASGMILLPVQYHQPEISTLDVLVQNGIHQAISTYETSLQGKEENTLYNIRKASREVNGILLESGESFSFNQLIGPAEKGDGYKESTIIANGQFINGYGGGVCQVSTTIYNAVLLANFQIIERYNHSIYGEATNYVPLGRDAAIFYGYKDLKFRNTLDQKVVLFCEIKDDKLVATVFGERALEETVRVVTQDKKIRDYDTIQIKQEKDGNSDNKVLQKGIPGYSIKTYRIILEASGERMELISQDEYASVPMKILVDE